MTFDDNALYRHPDIKELRDLGEEDPLEIEASKFSLNYIKLDGTIGCMVNGAGLAMATMDIIKLAGGEPANFLDVGGGANAEQIKNAFRILMSDTSVKAVLINIFGGILRCDILAQGVIAAVTDLGVRVPIVDSHGRHERRTRQADAARTAASTSRPPTPWAKRRRRSSSSQVIDPDLSPRLRPDERQRPRASSLRPKPSRAVIHYVRTHRQLHAPPRPGPDRPRGHVPRETGPGLRHERRRRRDARQGRHDARGLAGVRHGRGGGEADRRQRVGHLRAAARRAPMR